MMTNAKKQTYEQKEQICKKSTIEIKQWIAISTGQLDNSEKNDEHSMKFYTKTQSNQWNLDGN